MPSKLMPFIFLKDKFKEHLKFIRKLTKLTALGGGILFGASIILGLVLYTLSAAADTEKIPPKPIFQLDQKMVDNKKEIIDEVKTIKSPVIISNLPQAPITKSNQLEQEKSEKLVPVNVRSVEPQWAKTIGAEVIVAFGWYEHPVFKEWRYHNGIDYKTKANENVKAISTGQVIETNKDNRNTIIIQNGEYTVTYSSLSHVNVAKGQEVEIGTIIGKSGQSNLDPYPHVHLSIKRNESYIDPLSVIK